MYDCYSVLLTSHSNLSQYTIQRNQVGHLSVRTLGHVVCFSQSDQSTPNWVNSGLKHSINSQRFGVSALRLCNMLPSKCCSHVKLYLLTMHYFGTPLHIWPMRFWQHVFLNFQSGNFQSGNCWTAMSLLPCACKSMDVVLSIHTYTYIYVGWS